MIQFNLLPDVKIEYLKVRRAKRLIMLIAALITGASLVVLILLVFTVHVFQKQHLENIATDIERDSRAIKSTPGIEKILTVQNQLISLPALHQQKPEASRVFQYIAQVTPANVTIANLSVDFSTNTVSLTGSAPALSDVNRFVDTLKFTEYTRGEAETLNAMTFNRGEHDLAFSNVVLGSFGRSDDAANFTIDLNFAPEIFQTSRDNPETADKNESKHIVKLIIPNIVTTRSQLEKPGPLFQELPNGEGN
jgi:Tfp pilus assembly protein PilN